MEIGQENFRRLILRKRYGENDAGFGVQGFPGAEFDGNFFKSVLRDGGTGQDMNWDGGFRIEDQSFEDSQIIDTMEQQAGIFVHRAVGKPFQNERHRNDGMPFHHMRLKHRDTLHADFALEGDGE